MFDRYDRFVHSVYAGALTEAPQTLWLAALRELSGADMTSLLTVASGAPIAYVVGDGFDNGIDRDYVEHFQYVDPIRDMINDFTGRDLASLNPFWESIDENSEFYRGYFLRLKLKHALRLGLEIGDAHLHFHMMRQSDRAFTDKEREVIKQVAPHLEEAWKLWAVVERERTRAQSALAAFDNLSVGFAMVSPVRAILHANAAMRELLTSNTGIASRNNKLTATTVSEQAALERLIGRAARGAEGVGGFLHLGNGSTRRLTLVAMPVATEWSASHETSVAIFASNPGRQLPWSAGEIRDLLGLTPKEAEIATLLASGMPTRSIANKLGIHTGSVREHIKAIFGKTDTHSQAELLNLLFQSVVALVHAPWQE